MNTKENHEDSVDQYLAKVKNFLMAFDHGDASWPDIKDEELNESDSLIKELFQLKWGEDCDGDSPIKFNMLFRRTHHLVWDSPILNGAQDESNAMCEARLLGNLRNVGCAISSNSELLRQIQMTLDEIRRNKLCVQASFPVFLIEYEKNSQWNRGENAPDRPASLHLTENDANNFVAPDEFIQIGKIKKRWAIPDTYANADNDFAEYRHKVEKICNAVQPKFGVLEKLNIRFNIDPKLDQKNK
jgi:hypothetical protein